jgi:hypothetical protein
MILIFNSYASVLGNLYLNYELIIDLKAICISVT